MMLDTPTVWDDEKNVDTLKRMWADGASAGEIARALGQDVTRGAVIGKVHRLKLQKREKTSITAQSVTSKRGRQGNPGQANIRSIIHRKKGREAAADDARTRGIVAARDHVPFRAGSEIDMGGVDVTRRLGLMDIGSGDCHWIDGDPLAVHSYCGKPVKPGSSWCPHHHKRVFPGRANLSD